MKAEVRVNYDDLVTIVEKYLQKHFGSSAQLLSFTYHRGSQKEPGDWCIAVLDIEEAHND